MKPEISIFETAKWQNDAAFSDATETRVSRAAKRLDALIVGAGQAGLALGHSLRASGLSFRLLDRHERVGDSWRHRFDSLRLFTSRQLSALPGLPLPGDPGGFPGKNEIADYLEAYATHFDLPVSSGESVVSLRASDGGFAVNTSAGNAYQSTAVVIAAGAFQRSNLPDFASRLAPDVLQLTGATYRRPSQIPPGRALVVGGGASGRQIARELAGQREVWLSVGRSYFVPPSRILGQDIMLWYYRCGALTADKDSLYARLNRRTNSFPDSSLRLKSLRRKNVRVVGRTVAAEERSLQFESGERQSFAAVIWAIGYHDDSSWLKIANAVDEDGSYRQDRGRSPVPGLYHLGRHWQNTRSSGLLCGVGRDAAGLAAELTSYVKSVGCRVS